MPTIVVNGLSWSNKEQEVTKSVRAAAKEIAETGSKEFEDYISNVIAHHLGIILVPKVKTDA